MTKTALLSLLLCAVFLGDTPTHDVVILAPSLNDSTSSEEGKLLLVSTSKDIGKEILFSTQWKLEKQIPVSSKMDKDNFLKAFVQLFASQTTIENLSYRFRLYDGSSKTETLSFSYVEAMSVKAFWQRPEFGELLKLVKTTTASDIIISARGWKDSLLTTDYDDPNSDVRSLFKIHVNLIPGRNNTYLTPHGKKDIAVVYSITYVNESSPIEDHSERFHNSTLEQSCMSCHEGLASADGGKSMTADCSVCHKAFQNASYKHAPVEMSECNSCHAWSVEKNSMSVTKAVPDICYDCHTEKKESVENSATPHPVASECLTCHSPHGSRENHLLKKNVYELCTGCHEEFSKNHPVGKHPLRFEKIAALGEQEISCVSCHNPHGSENPSLLTVGGGRMAICIKCHQK